jgi:hypothetical protein
VLRCGRVSGRRGGGFSGAVPAVVPSDRMGCLKATTVAGLVVPHPDYVRFAAHYGFRLERAGWIRRRVRGGGRRGLRVPGWTLLERPVDGELGGAAPVGLGELSHDLFRWGTGVGKAAGRVLRGLRAAGRPVRAAELAGAAGWPTRAVSRLLRDLEAAGLARRCGRSWTHTGESLDAAARRLGAAGARARQAAQLARRRAARVRARNDWRRERMLRAGRWRPGRGAREGRRGPVAVADVLASVVGGWSGPPPGA